MLKDFSNSIYLLNTLNGIAILDATALETPEAGVRYVRYDTVNSLLAKSYQAGLDSRKNIYEMTTIEKN